MGLDVGTKKVGVAVSDAAYQIAAPLTTLDRHYGICVSPPSEQ